MLTQAIGLDIVRSPRLHQVGQVARIMELCIVVPRQEPPVAPGPHGLSSPGDTATVPAIHPCPPPSVLPPLGLLPLPVVLLMQGLHALMHLRQFCLHRCRSVILSIVAHLSCRQRLGLRGVLLAHQAPEVGVTYPPQHAIEGQGALRVGLVHLIVVQFLLALAQDAGQQGVGPT